MKKLHQKLLLRSKTYAKWHSHPAHGITHFLVVIAVGVLFTSGVVSSINKTTALNYQEIAQTQVPAALTAGKASQHLPDLTTQLLQALKQYQKAALADKHAALSNLVMVALARREAMLAQVEADPQKIVLSALPASLANKMPAEVAGLVEQRASLQGTLKRVHADDFQNSISHDSYTLDTAENSFTAYFTGNPDLPIVGTTKAKLQGIQLDNALVVDNLADKNNIEVMGTYLTAQTLSPTVNKKVLVLLYKYSDTTSEPWTLDQIRSIVFTGSNSVNKYYQENSYGQLAFTGKLRSDGDVFGYFTLPSKASDGCRTGDVNLAAASGVDITGYDLIINITTRNSLCNWAGLGGNPISLNGDVSLIAIAHEVGHYLRASHSNSYSCYNSSGARVSISNNCTSAEYGDPFTVMGRGTRHHHAPTKSIIGWLDPVGIQTITGGNAVYTIAPAEQYSSNVQILKIPRSVVNNVMQYYTVEYRQPYGFDSFNSADPVVNGVTIRLTANSLIDTTPDTASFIDAPLTAGRTFTDPDYGINITTLSVSPSAATVRVSFGQTSPACVKSKPTISVFPVSQTTAAGQAVNYSVTVTNNDSATCPATTFVASAASLPSGFTYSGSSASVAPGSSAALKLSVASPAGYPDSSNIFTVAAADATDSSHSNTTQATYIVFADLIGPTVSITNPANGYTITSRSKSLIISATAADNIGVAKVEFYVDGRLMATDTAAPYSYKWAINKTVSAGAHYITATAYDTTSNSSSATVTMYK